MDEPGHKGFILLHGGGVVGCRSQSGGKTFKSISLKVLFILCKIFGRLDGSNTSVSGPLIMFEIKTKRFGQFPKNYNFAEAGRLWQIIPPSISNGISFILFEEVNSSAQLFTKLFFLISRSFKHNFQLYHPPPPLLAPSTIQP